MATHSQPATSTATGLASTALESLEMSLISKSWGEPHTQPGSDEKRGLVLLHEKGEIFTKQRVQLEWSFPEGSERASECGRCDQIISHLCCSLGRLGREVIPAQPG